MANLRQQGTYASKLAASGGLKPGILDTPAASPIGQRHDVTDQDISNDTPSSLSENEPSTDTFDELLGKGTDGQNENDTVK